MFDQIGFSEPILLVGYLLLINGLAFLLMGIDKYQAVHNGWRVAERYFALASLLGGLVGIYIGMQVFRHKTQKTSFQVKVLTAFVIFLILIYQNLKG